MSLLIDPIGFLKVKVKILNFYVAASTLSELQARGSLYYKFDPIFSPWSWPGEGVVFISVLIYSMGYFVRLTVKISHFYCVAST